MRKNVLFAFSVLVLVVGCSHIKRPDEVKFYFSPGKVADAGEVSSVRRTVAELNARNSSLRTSPERLKEAYKELTIRNLQDIPPEEYGNFRKFAEKDQGRVYVIVHPAYYAFFSDGLIFSDYIDPDIPPAKNIVERFCAKPSFYDSDLVVMQEQERMLKDFLEVTAAEKKLLILILPSDYKSHLGYGYADGFDEYVRYLNDVSGGSESVLYLESLEFNSGYLGEGALTVLSEFLRSAGVSTLMLGGEFAGRCLDNVYLSLLRKIDKDKIYIVPEITVMTHKDIETSWRGSLSNSDDIMQFISEKLSSPHMTDGKGLPRQIRHLYIYEITENGLKPIN